MPMYSFNQFVGGQTNGMFDHPSECPQCHHSIDPRHLGGVATNRDESAAELIFQCPRELCRTLFIAYYKLDNGVRTIERVAPVNPISQPVPEDVASLSPRFVKVFNQATAAEANGLDEIAGIGLRKALEFLVKDYAIRQHPSDEDQIKRMPLATCINKYLNDPHVNACAQRATWLGNDETHYVRRWEDRDIKDLNRLIHLTVNWIDNVLVTKKYVEEMQG